jgi:hypothetical protein
VIYNKNYNLKMSGIFNLRPSSNKYAFDMDKYLELSAHGELLDESCIKVICSKVREVLSMEDNVKSVRSPVTVVGDVHG